MITTKLHVDLHWLNRISINLERFRKVRTDVFNCRCPICGDSKKSTKKARFFFYAKKMKLLAQCKNCGYSGSFFKFMKDVYPNQFDEYKRETLFDTFSSRKVKANIEVAKTTPVFEKVEDLHITKVKTFMTPILELEENHPARKFLKERAFSEVEMKRLYFTDDFKKIAERINPEATDNLADKDPRVIIPFINTSGIVEMIQGRAIKNSNLKYISIKAHDDIPKLYGMYEIDESQTVYCVEGPLDSLFVDNCIATCDANLTRSPADVLIWDNQPRNRDVVRYMSAAIDAGRSIVIWPNSPDKKVDINDLIKLGVTREMLMDVIRKCTFKGMTAKLKFAQWKKI